MIKPITLAEYERRRQRAEDLRRQEARLAGELDRTAKDLAYEFAVKDLAAARKLLAELEREAEQAENAAAKAEREFVKQWGEKLEQQ
jgi:hypothetical protein